MKILLYSFLYYHFFLYRICNIAIKGICSFHCFNFQVFSGEKQNKNYLRFESSLRFFLPNIVFIRLRLQRRERFFSKQTCISS